MDGSTSAKPDFLSNDLNGAQRLNDLNVLNEP